jgi:cell division protein FtsQ
MAIKKNIKRMLLATLWLALFSTVLVLLVAAINKKNQERCKGIDINIKGVGAYYFVDRQDVLAVVAPGKKNRVKGQSIKSFDLRRLEATLEKNVWVKDAELYFDNNAVLQVNIEEREPVARIFTVTGVSFYIDSSVTRLPVTDKMSVKLPVFTNYPTDEPAASRLGAADSLLLQQVKHLSRFIAQDSFWTAQIAQVDITAERTFDLVPVVGNHIIQFGDGENYEEKFRRLLLFYKQVLSKVGMDKYASINVQYSKQVIGTKKGTFTKIDSLQALKNIQRLIQQARDMQPDTVSTLVDKKSWPHATRDSTLSVTKRDAALPAATVSRKPSVPFSNPSPKNRSSVSTNKKKKPAAKATIHTTVKQPKAVMKKRGR